MIAGAPGLFCCQYRTTDRSAPTELGGQLWAYDSLYGFSQEFPMSAALTKMVGVVEVALIQSSIPENCLTMSHLLPDPLDNPLSLHTVLADLAGVLSEQLQTRSLMTQTLCLVGETTAGDPVEHKLALQQPLWGKKPLQAALLDLMSSGRFPAPLARLSVILTDLVPAQVEQLSLFAPVVATWPVMPLILRARYARYTYQAQLIAPDHPLLEQRFVWYAAAT